MKEWNKGKRKIQDWQEERSSKLRCEIGWCDWHRKLLPEAYFCDFYSDLSYFSVLSNKLDAPMLNGIISALSQEIVPQGNNC